MRESELYEPVRRLFEENGCHVNAEVCGCDLTAVSDDGRVYIAELKRGLTVELLAQCVERQKTAELIYAAVPKPKRYEPKKMRRVSNLIKRLGLGLIFVTFRGEYSFAEIIIEPEQVRKSDPKKKRGLLREIDGRTAELNTGGVSGRRIVTAYMERAFAAACILEDGGELSPKEIKERGGSEDVQRILTSNVYGWFEKVRRGVWKLSDKGAEEILLYPQLYAYYKQLGGDKIDQAHSDVEIEGRHRQKGDGREDKAGA